MQTKDTKFFRRMRAETCDRKRRTLQGFNRTSQDTQIKWCPLCFTLSLCLHFMKLWFSVIWCRGEGGFGVYNWTFSVRDLHCTSCEFQLNEIHALSHYYCFADNSDVQPHNWPNGMPHYPALRIRGWYKLSAESVLWSVVQVNTW